MVGIVPIQNGPENDGFPWPKCLTPLYNNYTALHRSVLECAMAGCSSIWVITEKRYIPLMKTVVGSYVQDPILAQLPVEYKENFSMRVPIWYISIPVKDLGRRECYGRTILAGAEYATLVAKRLSEKLAPEKFYVSFPQAVYSPWSLQNYRKKIKSTDKNFFLKNDKGTIKNGIELGFTFFSKDFERFKKDFRKKDQGAWTGKDFKSLVRRPIEERNLANKLTLDEVFESATLEGAVLHEFKKTYNISTWEGYVEYINSSHFYKMPKKVKYFKHSKMGNLESRLIDCIDTEEEE
jgi:hypothetical protein